MNKNTMQEQWERSYLFAGNMAYLDGLYDQYLEDRNTVSEQWRVYFDSLGAVTGQQMPLSAVEQRFAHITREPRTQKNSATSVDPSRWREQLAVLELVNAYRALGHYEAHTDPLGLAPIPVIDALRPESYGLQTADLDKYYDVELMNQRSSMRLADVLVRLKSIYCGSCGFEFTHLFSLDEIRWFKERIEHVAGAPTISRDLQIRILKDLIRADSMENFLGKKYVGQKRFSLEGGDNLIPMMNEIIQRGSAMGMKECVIGMAHRGRLNVLINVVGKPFQKLMDEFEGKYTDEHFSGDVKYHKGFAAHVTTPHGSVHTVVAFNPSHLEAVYPVVEGAVRAKQTQRRDVAREQVVPVILHGDASFIGQGVVMETLSLSQARGYTTGGTIHIVVNNQVGFTTSDPQDARSTFYCTDIAKMIQAPVLHVNGDDAEAVWRVTQLTVDYRQRFKKDVVIDLVCYRRHGHQEVDEPSATQPLMYQKIKAHPVPYRCYADRLIAAGIIQENDLSLWLKEAAQQYEQGQSPVAVRENFKDDYTLDWSPYHGKDWRVAYASATPLTALKELAKALDDAATQLTLQPQVKKMFDERAKMTRGELAMNWGYAETLAYATLLAAGHSVRLAGEDSERGTFAHRHCVIHDFSTGAQLTPLNQLGHGASFTVINSILSEEAALGFEYGFATSAPATLVLWEAQFGDFANGAQVYIDQFISAAEQKWGLLCGLVLLLPHGYEGQGPEHSSARLERFLQLCAQDNMQVCVPTTPAQIYHLLRRQVLRPYRKPLVVMTPKSLLRHRLAVSTWDELAHGTFQVVVPEVDDLNSQQITRVICCSGKVYYDVLQQRREQKLDHVAIIRLEQLYPFPHTELRAALQRYNQAREVVWCQEEPENQGAYHFCQHFFRECLTPQQMFSYAGREPSASPAVGSPSVHKKQQDELIRHALEG